MCYLDRRARQLWKKVSSHIFSRYRYKETASGVLSWLIQHSEQSAATAKQTNKQEGIA